MGIDQLKEISVTAFAAEAETTEECVSVRNSCLFFPLAVVRGSEGHMSNHSM